MWENVENWNFHWFLNSIQCLEAKLDENQWLLKDFSNNERKEKNFSFRKVPYNFSFCMNLLLKCCVFLWVHSPQTFLYKFVSTSETNFWKLFLSFKPLKNARWHSFEAFSNLHNWELEKKNLNIWGIWNLHSLSCLHLLIGRMLGLSWVAFSTFPLFKGLLLYSRGDKDVWLWLMNLSRHCKFNTLSLTTR